MMQWFWWLLIAFGVISIWVLLAMCQVASDADDRIEAGLWEDAAMADNSGRCVFCDKTVIIRREMLNGEPVDSVDCPHCGEAYVTSTWKEKRMGEDE